VFFLFNVFLGKKSGKLISGMSVSWKLFGKLKSGMLISGKSGISRDRFPRDADIADPATVKV